jgi:hypothetical protein
LNGVATFSHKNSEINQTGLTWKQFTDVFVATGASTTITFLNGDMAFDSSNGLDNIDLLDIGPAPEPASVMLLASGLAGLGLLRRRRPKRGDASSYRLTDRAGTQTSRRLSAALAG